MNPPSDLTSPSPLNKQLEAPDLPISSPDHLLAPHTSTPISTSNNHKPLLLGIIAALVLILGLASVYAANLLSSQKIHNSNAQTTNEYPLPTPTPTSVTIPEEEQEINDLDVEDPTLDAEFLEIQDSLKELE